MTTLDIIKELCDQKGMSISALERELGFSNGSLSKSKILSSERVYELSRYFNKPMEYFITGEVERTNDELKKLEEKRAVLERINELNVAIMEAYKQIAAYQAELDQMGKKYEALKTLEGIE